MKHVPTYEHLKRRVERMQKKDVSEKLVANERQKVLNVLNPRAYESQDEFLETMTSMLQRFKP
jgi:hypothetical protein